MYYAYNLLSKAYNLNIEATLHTSVFLFVFFFIFQAADYRDNSPGHGVLNLTC